MKTTEELLKNRAEQAWVINKLLPVGGKLMLGGPPKSQKSFNALKLIHCVLREPFFHGFRVDVHGRVLVVELDMPTESHARRIEQFHNVSYNFDGCYHITRSEIPKSFNLLTQQHYNWLAEQVADLKPTMVVFDVLRSIFLGNENDSSAMSEIMMRLDEILLEGNSAAVILHHSKKAGFDKETTMSVSPIEAVRGSSVIAGSMDTIMALNDTGHTMQIQGRDIGNTSYFLKREFGGLPNRFIKIGGTGRQQSIEKLLASIMTQCPKESNANYFKWTSEYVEDMNEEEFEQVRSIVSANPLKYEWA
jgi:RecA-family ATPase